MACRPVLWVDDNHEVVVTAQRLVTQLVVADRRNDQVGDVRSGVLLAVDDDVRDIGKGRMRLRCSAALFNAEEFVRTNERGDIEICGRTRTRIP